MFHGYRLVTQQSLELSTLRYRVAEWLPVKAAGALFRQAQNRQVVLRQADHQFVITIDLGIHGHFALERRKIEILREKTIRLLPVVELVVVRAGIGVLMPPERVFLSVELEKTLYVIEDVRLHQGPAETAVVLRVIDQQRRARSAHGSQVRIILTVAKISGVLLEIVADVFRMLDTGYHSSETGDGNRRNHALVERAERNGLPAAARKTGDAQPRT